MTVARRFQGLLSRFQQNTKDVRTRAKAEPLVTDLSEACRFIDTGSNETLMWFSGLHEPFLPTKILTSSKINGLFLRDERFDWYMGGIAGLADDFAGSMHVVSEFLTQKGTLLTIGGQSSGGYAALRASLNLNPALCIAFSPQTANLNGQPGIPLVPLGPLYAERTVKYPVLLHLARSEKDNAGFFWDDWQQIAPLMELEGITVVRHPFDVHAVSLPLYGQGRFLETIVSNMRLYAPVDPHPDGS